VRIIFAVQLALQQQVVKCDVFQEPATCVQANETSGIRRQEIP
jgi:hypothetical protein